MIDPLCHKHSWPHCRSLRLAVPQQWLLGACHDTSSLGSLPCPQLILEPRYQAMLHGAEHWKRDVPLAFLLTCTDDAGEMEVVHVLTYMQQWGASRGTVRNQKQIEDAQLMQLELSSTSPTAFVYGVSPLLGDISWCPQHRPALVLHVNIPGFVGQSVNFLSLLAYPLVNIALAAMENGPSILDLPSKNM